MSDSDIFSCIGSLNYSNLVAQDLPNHHKRHSSPFLSDCLPFLSDYPPFKLDPFQGLDGPEEGGLNFTEINFFPGSLSDDLELSQAGSFQKPEYEGETKCSGIQKSEKVGKVCNNASDYILKHCLRKMLVPHYRKQVGCYCLQVGISYKELVEYWEGQLKQRVHMGVNRFEKMVRGRSPLVQVFGYFLTVYLQQEYLLYLVQSSIENKAAYIDCAIKLVYIAQVSKEKAYQLIQQAPTGPSQ